MLASGSPRRRELLALLGLPFEVVPADVDESVAAGRDAGRARAPAGPRQGRRDRRFRFGRDVVVLAADTTVEVAGEILGKPTDGDDARRMLRSLSARTHLVHTAVAVRRNGRTVQDVVTTAVSMTPLTEAAIEWYLATGEPMDKAGGYAIQGTGGAFVAAIEGSASNVVGLPLATVVDLLGRQGVVVASGTDKTARTRRQGARTVPPMTDSG